MASREAPITTLRNGPADAPTMLVLAPGASEPMDSPLLTRVAESIAAAGIAVTRFEFSHLAERRSHGTRRPPPRMPTLLSEYRAVLDDLDWNAALVVGGRSLGGRVASHLVDDVAVRGLIAISYPFHPPRRPELTRTAHLAHLAKPALFVQGDRDPFGTPAEVESYGLSATCAVRWIPDGDHALEPRRRSDRTWADNIRAVADAAIEFICTVANAR